MQVQVEDLQTQNNNLKASSIQANNSLSHVGASQGGGYIENENGAMLPIDESTSRMRQNILARESSM
jgi:hypothetical protein